MNVVTYISVINTENKLNNYMHKRVYISLQGLSFPYKILLNDDKMLT